MTSAPTCYSYSSSTGEFTGISYANPSPLEPDVWLYPALTTTEAPPQSAPNATNVFTYGSWESVPDHRGETWYTATDVATVITTIGDPTAVGLFATPPVIPTPAPTEADVDAERDRRIYSGYRFEGAVYQTDVGAITNVLGATQLAFMAIVAGAKAGNLRWANPEADFVWIAADNTKISMDAQTVVAFGQAVAAYKSALTFAGRALKDQLAAGNAIDLTADGSWGFGPNGVPTTGS